MADQWVTLEREQSEGRKQRVKPRGQTGGKAREGTSEGMAEEAAEGVARGGYKVKAPAK